MAPLAPFLLSHSLQRFGNDFIVGVRHLVKALRAPAKAGEVGFNAVFDFFFIVGPYFFKIDTILGGIGNQTIPRIRL